MASYRFEGTESLDDSEWPLRSFDIDLGIRLDLADSTVPDAAMRRLAVRALQRLIQDLEAGDLSPSTAMGKEAVSKLKAGPDEDPGWVQPAGMDLRVVKSAHRVIEEVARRSASGRAVRAADLIKDGLVSAPTMARLLRGDEPAGQYLAPFIMATSSGRTTAIDLTPKGRLMASRIRAGVVPS